MRATVVWEALQWPSVEHVVITPAGDGWTADGSATAVVDGLPTRLAYQIAVGGDGAVRTVDIRETVSGALLALRADGPGAWHDADGNAVTDLDGCIDVDISVTPLTNTLPIRRLGLDVGESADILVGYIDVPTLMLRPAAQRYTRLTDRTYQYESGTFRADVIVDEAGLVIDYLRLWRRVGVPAAEQQNPFA